MAGITVSDISRQKAVPSAMNAPKSRMMLRYVPGMNERKPTMVVIPASITGTPTVAKPRATVPRCPAKFCPSPPGVPPAVSAMRRKFSTWMV